MFYTPYEVTYFMATRDVFPVVFKVFFAKVVGATSSDGFLVYLQLTISFYSIRCLLGPRLECTAVLVILCFGN